MELRHKTSGDVICIVDSPDGMRTRLAGADLSRVSLRDKMMPMGANLSGTNLENADLEGTRFPYVNLSGASLHKASLRNADLHQANLTGADLSEANLTGATVFSCKSKGIDLRGIRASFSQIIFCDFSQTVMPSIRWRHPRFANVNLSGADLSSAVLLVGIFDQCNLRGLRLAGAELRSTIFRNCDLDGVDFTDSTLQAVSIVNCRNLHKAVGLDSIRHKAAGSFFGPPSLDIATLHDSICYLPDRFLRAFSLSDHEIAALRGAYKAA